MLSDPVTDVELEATDLAYGTVNPGTFDSLYFTNTWKNALERGMIYQVHQYNETKELRMFIDRSKYSCKK